MKLMVKLVLRAYQRIVSPLLPTSCRYVPTCSEYAIEAIELHGVIRGSLIGAARLLRCHPFAKSGYDPVPPVLCAKGQLRTHVCQKRANVGNFLSLG
jgi:putative membrane protein insertion efficiency factor